MAKPELVEEQQTIQMDDKSMEESLKDSQSKVLVIGFCGPVGSGIPAVTEQVKKILINHNYESHVIKMSDIIKKHVDKTSFRNQSLDFEKMDEATRIETLQDAGNELRSEHKNYILSMFAIREILLERQKRIHEDNPTETIDLKIETPHRLAFLIDSIKHPEEIDLLRIVYGNMFYLFGILCAEQIRVDKLVTQGVAKDRLHTIIERDKKQDVPYGQQLVKALQYADFFIRNHHKNINGLQNPIERFFHLIFGTKLITPNKDEFAMHVAQSAGMRSACMSRQIGAAILNKDGEIVSTGSNDVPSANGGLYTPEDGDADCRCAFMEEGNCKNDEYKKKIKDKVKRIISEQISSIGNSIIDKIGDEIYDDTWLKDVLEFSRAVHAEMAAIVSAARNGYSVMGSVLYTLTFPCHVCARHIVAAGIKRVVYIEPYEKSQALELHRDAIELDPAGEQCNNKVIFMHFEGVAPKQYLKLFKMRAERKINGKLNTTDAEKALPVVPEYLYTFLDYEAKITEHLKKRNL